MTGDATSLYFINLLKMNINSIEKIRNTVHQVHPEYLPFVLNSQALEEQYQKINFAALLKLPSECYVSDLHHLQQQSMIATALQCHHNGESVDYLAHYLPRH